MAGFSDRTVSGFDMRALPHPAVTLAIEFGEGRLTVDDTTGQRAEGSLVAGLMPGPARLRGVAIAAVQVRLSPLSAQSVFGVSPTELDGAAIGLDDLWGRQASLIREQLAEAPSWDARFRLVEDLLVDRQQARSTVDPEVAFCWEQIVAGRGQIRIGDLAAACGWSRKRLWSRFRAQLGFTPKRGAMVVRFDSAAHRLVAGQDPADVAATSGYVDQSHLHRDVRAFAGCTPVGLTNHAWLAVDDVAWPAAAGAVL